MGESGPFYLTSVSNGHVLARSPNGQPSGVVVQNRGDQDQPQQWMIERGEEPDIIALRCLSNDEYLHANGGTNWSTVGTGEKQWWRCSGQDVTAPQACRLSPVDYPNVYLNHFQGIRVAKGQSMKVHMWQWDKNWEFCLTWYICNAGPALQAVDQKASDDATEETNEESEGLFGSTSGTETPTQSKLDSSRERIKELEEQLARQSKELEQQKLALKQELEEKFSRKLKEREEQAKQKEEDAQTAQQRQEEEKRKAKQKLQDEEEARRKLQDELRAKQKADEERKAKQKMEEEKKAKQKQQDEEKAKQKQEDERRAKQKQEDEKKAKQKLEDEKKAKQKKQQQQQQQQESKPKAVKKQTTKSSLPANITVPATDRVSKEMKKDSCKHMVLSPPRKIRKKVVGIIYAQDEATGTLTNKVPGAPRTRKGANNVTRTMHKDGNTVMHTTWTNGTNGVTTRRDVTVRSG